VIVGTGGDTGRDEGLGRGELFGDLSDGCRVAPAETLQPAAEPGGVADRQPVEPRTQLGDGRFGHSGKDS